MQNTLHSETHCYILSQVADGLFVTIFTQQKDLKQFTKISFWNIKIMVFSARNTIRMWKIYNFHVTTYKRTERRRIYIFR